MNITLKKAIFPIVVIVLAIVVARVLIAAKPEPNRQAPAEVVPVVEIVTAQVAPHTYTVDGQGTVQARTSSKLVAEVAGRVISIDDGFVEGGFFETGQVLLTVDDRDYRAAVAKAEADVAQMKLAIAREEEESRVARDEWQRFGREGEPTSLVLREPQLEQARAALAAAVANLARAQRDLDRTRIQAPYTGRVRRKAADVGDYLQRGAPAAEIYAVDYAEVRVPLADNQLQYLHLPYALRGVNAQSERGPEVVVTGQFAGAQREWRGFVHRTEGEVDARSRMVHVVVRVADPYGTGADQAGIPLGVGMFVETAILGRTVANAIVLPRKSILRPGTLAVVDADGRLDLREVKVLRSTHDSIVLEAGIIADGERVVVSQMDAVVDGMKVRIMGNGPRSEEATR